MEIESSVTPEGYSSHYGGPLQILAFLLWTLAMVTPYHREVHSTTHNLYALPTRNCLQAYFLS